MPTLDCNFRCLACFEDPIHSKTVVNIPLNLDAMEQTLAKLWEDTYYHGSGIGIHGGECLLAPPVVLDRLFEVQQKYTGGTSVVTNASLITPAIMRLFKKYKTDVSVSVDGPPEYNLLRGPSPLDKDITGEYNKLLNDNIKWLREEEISVSVMCIINKFNSGDAKKVKRMKQWFNELATLGIRGGRINPMYADGAAKKYELTNDELLYAYIEYTKMTFESSKMRWLPFREMIDNVLNFSSSPCIFGGCDFLCTHTVTIFPDGSLGNCDRTFSDGVGIRSEYGKREGRTSALQQTQCAGCNYWNICKGGCPCEGVDGDWRNKTRFCEAIAGTYDFITDYLTGLLPNVRISNDSEPFRAMGWGLVDRPTTFGNYTAKTQALPQTQQPNGHSDSHGDHHGDKPHGDHADEAHNDQGGVRQ